MTSKEIEELAGHRQVPAWVIKLVSDAVAIEREACARVADDYDVADDVALSDTAEGIANAIRARGRND